VIAIVEPRAARDPMARIQLANALGALGSTYSLEEKLEDARAALSRSLSMEEAQLGPDHPEIGRTLADLAHTELALDHEADGRAHLQRSRSIFVRAYGEGSELVLLTDIVLADIERVDQRCNAAVPMYERVLGALPPDHRMIGEVESDLGNCARDTNDERGAVAHFERALAAFEHAGKSGLVLGDLRNNYGMALAELGRDADARAQAEQALADYERANVEPKARIDSWRLLAEIEQRAGHVQRAIELDQKAVAAIGDDARPQFIAARKDAEAQIAAWSKQQAAGASRRGE
jgi:tetratricopeptide (TPR) repeat protein